MKKIIMVLMASIIAVGFTACGGETAEVKWITNASTTYDTAVNHITDIAWTSGGLENQTWSDQLPVGTPDETDRKTVTALAGEADCVDDGGSTYLVNIDGSTSENVESVSGNIATLKADSNVDLVIDSLTETAK